jgi:hypothetical protein
MAKLKTTLLLVTLMVPTITLASSFNVKTGAWETTTSSSISQAMIPAETLAKIPPQMRAQIEAQMKASQKPHVTKGCITQDDLNQNKMLESAQILNCTSKIISSSSNKITTQSNCPPPHESLVISTMEAITSEKMVGKIDITQPKNAKIYIDIKSQWLSSSCVGVPPRTDWKAKMEAIHKRHPDKF